MCDFSQRLIAWLDNELSPQEAASFERHIPVCSECQSQAGLYRQLNETIDAYCQAAIVSGPVRHSNKRVWRPVLAGTAASAAAAAALLFFLFKPGERPPQIPPAATSVRSTASITAAPPPIASRKTPLVPAPRQKASHRIKNREQSRGPAFQNPAPAHNETWLPNQAPVYIAIPADALFPPGALPEGVGFIADVNWRMDGSAQRLQLQPQLIGFEKRGTRP